MSVYKLILPNLQQRINNLVELISDIKDPHLKIPNPTAADNGPENNETLVSETITDSNMDTASEHTTAAPDLSKLTPRELQLKISELKFKVKKSVNM